ncbi:transmembrane protein 94 [Plutella xylostella]|uniref:transmembrane protein 94 n=1 Tax=Plutella xylostella TaxID=51655 RepID=UPI002032E362|nr:transmembrane protein 94 [Plutella xylostella]
MDKRSDQILGFSTKEALQKLKNDISVVINEHQQKNSLGYGILREVVSFSSDKVLVSGVTYILTFVYILCLLITYFIGESVQSHPVLLFEALFLFILLVINFLLALNEEYLYRNEIPLRAKKVLETLDNATESSVWKTEHYPHLCAPFSPCVTLQWTYRDGTIVNLPWALLVEGDVVVLRPGQEVPGRCRELPPGEEELDAPQTFQPNTQKKESFSKPRVRTPLQNRAFRMLETPCLRNLQVALEKATSRPLSVFEKRRYLCTIKLVEGIILPLVICIVVTSMVARQWAGLGGSLADWLLLPVVSTYPLSLLTFCVAWHALRCYGLARFKLISSIRTQYEHKSSISEEGSEPLLRALSSTDLKPECLKSLATTFVNILLGREDMVCRTANIVQVLGSISALCCIDKKGILSWPNPTAEKVFFLRNSSPASPSSSNTSLGGSMGRGDSTPEPSERPHEPTTVAEVLDLTHDQNAPFCVEFDDQRWRQHLTRLKPLGLAAVLNTCAPQPRHTYAHFCAHLTCEAQLSEDLVPVTNRRCLCELAKQIGFTDAVAENYGVADCLAVFRHLQADTIRRETRFVRSLQLSSRVKVPLPHMLAVIVRAQPERLQMLTQGTADIILDSCVDYWDGRDLTPLSAADRKKIIDFYQRNSLTAYCTAFAYKPLNRGISPQLSQMYLELPADSRPLYAPLSQQWRDTPALHFHSTDSLLFNEVNDEDVDDVEGYFDLQCNQVFIGMVTMQYQAQSDMVELIERLERACIRFVHFSKENELRSRVFSEKMGLESGWNCHISLMSDDEPKSGSPPPGREAPARQRAATNPPLTNRLPYVNSSNNMEKSKALSMSAPGAINVDSTTVKFHNEVSKPRHSITTASTLKYRNSVTTETQQSADSLLQGSEVDDSPMDACRSLSCLTDSTDHSAPVNFDMSNRAKLPRGIENIRPHIAQVDNVPLLVSLFTDCTARSVRLMTEIMQECGEVVVIMGSPANASNMRAFMQADASIAVEPLYPVLCQKMPPYEVPTKCIGPIDLARALNSIPCSLSLQNKWQGQPYCNANYCSKSMTRDADVSLFALITMSRHFMMCAWNCVQFWLCAVCFLTLIQVGSLCSALPPALGAGGALALPAAATALAASLAFPPTDPAVMQRPKEPAYSAVNIRMALFIFWCYGCKFIPAVISIIVLYWRTLRAVCEQVSLATNATQCWIVYPVNVGNYSSELDLSTRSLHGWGDDFYDGYYLVQHIVMALTTVHLIVISLSFVHRQSSIWQKSFWSNKVWCITVVVILILQSISSLSWLSSSHGECARWRVCGRRYSVPWALLVAYCASPIVVFGLNEFIKWQEIKADIRNQRRARLDFGTKLGMNSPF